MINQVADAALAAEFAKRLVMARAAASQTVAAHRGVHSHKLVTDFTHESPLENTQAAVARALEERVPLIETDAHATADDVLVSHHDRRIGAYLNDERGQPIAEVTYAQLAADFDGHPPAKIRDIAAQIARGTRPATADEAAYAPILLQETKTVGHEKQLLDEIDESLPPEQVRVFSFDVDSVKALRELARPGTQVGLLAHSDATWAAEMHKAHGTLPETGMTGRVLRDKAQELGVDFVSIDANLARQPGMLTTLAEAGIPVAVYPGSTLGNLEQMAMIGDPLVDTIITDMPAIVLAARRAVIDAGTDLPQLVWG